MHLSLAVVIAMQIEVSLYNIKFQLPLLWILPTNNKTIHQTSKVNC